METHYTQNMGETTYTYGVNLEEHKKVIEKQQKRIAELEQELAKLKEKYNKTNEKLKNITEEIDNNFVHGQDYEKLKQELAELKEKAIVPRFKFDEECVVIMFGSYHFHRFIAQVKDDLCLTQPYNDTEEWYYVKPEMVFKTLEEAQDKLKEVQGNE